MKVYSYVLNIVKDHNLAEEITQNTFTKAITSKTYKGLSSEYTWLCSIAKNLCYDYFHKKDKTVDLSENIEMATDNKDSLNSIITKETSLAIHKILHELEEPYKEVFQLRIFGELSFKEIASIFGKTESWARVTYYRGKLKIKERLDLDE